jgi:hypothetical protein
VANTKRDVHVALDRGILEGWTDIKGTK